MTSRIDPQLIPANPNLEWERALWEAGILRIAGIDEAGRGALAGPVAAAAVILPPERSIARELSGVRDSKQMTPSQRESWSKRIQEIALAFGVGMASSKEIDFLRIVPATQLAAQRAIATLTIKPEHLLLDYIFLPDIPLPQTSLIKGDMRSLSIAAASVLAKTSRDALMIELDEQYPGYGLAKHKGYGTAAHRQAIEQLGPSAIHRMSFAPMRS
ncbi:MAG: ribonuclease HII [Anaerolineales bacterium]|nr:ribonuclease HII [Chloroflexota bacterium]MBL7162467.1 ribonuclease HII [Anaerolineales bacterium]